MSKINKHRVSLSDKKKFHWVHLASIVIVTGYFLLSKINIVNAMSQDSLINSFFQIYLFGSIFACLFLYTLSHKKFFPVSGDIERGEEKNENKLLKKYRRHGKILGTIIIGTIGGPIFSSLTARILLKNYRLKYLVIMFANIPSTILTVAISNGFIKFFNF
ncbi:hypothetical protein A2422_00450 [Candidatus Woesebacteria bacterium RIFOXYC1_FULL_31_51]|uniref:Uncharacterized protein n=1 Tax=Candidatus Woesebacteria bacterium GW2011_GWC2_31_9 TaxID=1618586 RepID=A0A0G0AYJ4_9BACT|nr:MAG: hypothetical protein UR17_C0001G0391 [Candidatus Woesebacteria bacterium GW2011_GWF1_31_35]KKP23120.1 MAG: hypothetical protein UR11_C0001G0094 [Candidatus Woesebacteria bacterium GW2011_GWC1_30_29]KKP26808.1 MAG: hypothetical protein UR13_C0002G0043 [Candidatus Woesebacteria bacterium GW2011_GWD1_31_12]KKP27383.1 MAG: hypothetical protein UR16_C0003G0043 [Candidatus Woesebacteria bacterium GW2011_GWB1_31_29]KKP31590.1 MAG: hypothetical protein UR21_C0007G0007 [Candidatus Woesebacteria 